MTGFSAQVAKSDAQGNDAGPFVSLKPAQTAVQTKDRNILEVPMPAMELPAKFTLRVKFKPDDKERVFDFTFADYSKEPGPAISFANAAAQARAAAQTGSQTPVIAASPDIPSPQSGDSVTFTPGTFRPEAPLPMTTQGLLQELAERADSVKMLLDAGNLGALWYPAIRAKDVALELEQSHADEIPEGQRAEMMSAVRRLTMAAWQIDAAGDLGNKERLLPLYREFSMAIGDVERLMEAGKKLGRTTATCVAIFLATGLFLIFATPHTDAHTPVTSKYDYNKDVFPLLREHCGDCHVPGGPAPMSLVTYGAAMPWAESIREELTAGRMPPWPVDPTSPAIIPRSGAGTRSVRVTST